MSETVTVALPVIHCLHCGARYIARTTTLPRTCARCRSPRWNVPKAETLVARCPLCPWTRKFKKQERAVALIQRHMLKEHGKKETERYLHNLNQSKREGGGVEEGGGDV